ncbi:MAG: queuosine precursor transporter [Planctomycetes bacterium]|nr:queuosine precursor transporter [Planctomycetota bacterium]
MTEHAPKSRLDPELYARRYDAYYVWFGCLFVTALVLTNIIGVKLFYLMPESWPDGLFGLGTITLTSGIITYPITFLVTDLVSEIWGKRRADFLVVIGFAMSFFMLALVQLANALIPSDIWANQNGPRALAMHRTVTDLDSEQLARVADRLALATRGEEGVPKLSRWEQEPHGETDGVAGWFALGEHGGATILLERFESGGRLTVEDDGQRADPSGAALLTARLLDGTDITPGEERRGTWPLLSKAHKQVAFHDTFASPAILVFASMLAYLVAQLFDVRLYHFWRRFTNGRHLWLRNNGSTLISQLVDTIIVNSIFLYFAFGTPWETIGLIILANYVFKGFMAIADTPFIYLLTFWVKRRLGFTWDEHVVPVHEVE